MTLGLGPGTVPAPTSATATPAAVNGTQVASWYEPCRGGCGTLIRKQHGRRYCSDRCRLLAWAKRQVERDTGQRALPGESRVERAFAEWIETPAGRYVEAEVVRMARQDRADGYRRGEINYYFATIRRNTRGLGRDGDGYAVNNSRRAHLVRKVMREHADLGSFFETRDLRGRAA